MILNDLGALRIALMILALGNTLLAAFGASLAAGEDSLWSVSASLIAPTLAPIWLVLLLFDYIMSRVRAADAEGDLQQRYTRISRIELGLMMLLLLYWVPFFMSLAG